jgi:hypothetical protein
MARLDRVERYVNSRKAAVARNAPSVYRDFGHPASFAVKFFDQSPKLKTRMSQIERDATQKKQEKCQELLNLQREYSDLTERFRNSTCDYYEVTIDPDLGYTEMQHTPSCVRCSLQTKANNLDISIYEWPLSSDRSIAKATVFEVESPPAFGDWRDASVYMIHDVLGCHYTKPQVPQDLYMLEHHHVLSDYLSHGYHQRRVVPLSSIKSHTTTHRKRQKAISHLENDDVCLDNALRYMFHDKSKRVWCAGTQSSETIAKYCLFGMPRRSEVLKRLMYKPPSAPDGVAPNEVLASLADCPPHFSIDEFKTFGAVPLGQNIIYSNILAQLAIPVIDFAKAEVQSLIAQIVQQTSPAMDARVERASHYTLTDVSFGHAMLDQLGIALGRVSENWESWRAAASFILLARRVLSLTTTAEVRDRSLEFLADARKVCLTWILRLKQSVSSSTDDEQRTELCSRAAEVALVCTSTFDVEHTFIDRALRQHSAVSALIQSAIVVQENVDTIRSDHQALHNSQLQSYRFMMYRTMPKLRDHILHDNNGLNEALRANWAAFQPASRALWTGLPSPQEHWLTVTSGTLPVHFNLLTAELLVNGSPLARLPKEYMQNAMYAPLFHQSALEVVPTNDPGMIFSAKSTYNEYKLDFGMLADDMLVVATRGKIK